MSNLLAQGTLVARNNLKTYHRWAPNGQSKPSFLSISSRHSRRLISSKKLKYTPTYNIVSVSNLKNKIYSHQVRNFTLSSFVRSESVNSQSGSSVQDSTVENVLRRKVNLWDQEKSRQLQNQKSLGPITAFFPDGRSVSVADCTKPFVSLVPPELKTNTSNPVVGVYLKTSGSNKEIIFELNRSIAEAANEAINDTQHIEITKWIHFDDPIGKQMFWHSSAHLLGAAVEMIHFSKWDSESLQYLNAFPIHTTQVDSSMLADRVAPLLDDGPALNETPGGFYYDFYVPSHLGEESFAKLEKIAMNLIKKNSAFERLEVSREFALDMFSYNPFKVALINKIPETDKLTLYRCAGSPFIDLCRGPHLPSAGMVGAFEVLRSSGAYWNGKQTNPYLQRLYGLSFPTKDQLKQWHTLREEAEKRDHRVIGKQQSLFMFHEYSPGSPFFLPHGTRIFNKLVEVVRKEYVTRGYSEVITPLIFDKKLWETSGHWQHYRDNMFLLKGDEQHKKEQASGALEKHVHHAGCQHHLDDDIEVSSGLKPMNCPGHCLTFKSEAKSYRDLPVRYADFSSLHRNEAKGTLGGLTRVRRFHQDDAHIFCTPEQIEAELVSVMSMVDHFYGKVFGFPYEIFVSTRPESSMGTDEEWNTAETALMNAVKTVGRKFIINPGDGAFYGPKIDFIVTDALHRKHQCATIQLDFQLPQRFGLSYMAADGSQKTPVIIHRAVMGSIERMFAMLVEHYAGKWPFWLSPRQVGICAVSEKHVGYAEKIGQELKDAGYFVEYYLDDTKLPNKVRQAQSAKCNYILVLGNAEMEGETVAVRMRDGTQLGTMKMDKLVEQLADDIKNWR